MALKAFSSWENEGKGALRWDKNKSQSREPGSEGQAEWCSEEMVSLPEAKASQRLGELETWCRGPNMDPLLLSTPFWFSYFELFFLGTLKNRKVNVLHPDPRWKVPESKHYYHIIIVIIPRSTCHKSKFRKYRKVEREYHPPSHEAEKSMVNILIFFFWYLLSAEFLIT